MKNAILLIMLIILIFITGCDMTSKLSEKFIEEAVEVVYGDEGVSRIPVFTSTSFYDSQKWEEYCVNYGKDYIKSPAKTVNDIYKIFYPLQESFNYVYDSVKWGEDHWDLLEEDYSGDCEDFAITLRERLILSGFETYNVTLGLGTVQNDSRTAGHMVAIVKANLGEFYICDQTGIFRFRDFKIKFSHRLDESGLFWRKYSGEKEISNE